MKIYALLFALIIAFPVWANDLSWLSPEDKAFIAKLEAKKKVAAMPHKTAPKPMRIATIGLSGRTCINCKYMLRQGYLSKVVSPEDGAWDLSSESFVFLNGKLTQVDPLIKGW